MTDTSPRVRMDSLLARFGYWRVEALGALRSAVVRSRLVPVAP